MSAWRCGGCGEFHDDVPRQWVVPLPDIVAGLSPEERSRRVREDGRFLVVDGEHRFVQGALEIPVIGEPDPFVYASWSSLSAANHEKWRGTRDADCEGMGPYFGWLSNSLRGYPETLNLKLHVHPRAGRLPWLELEPTAHPLAREQREGVPPARLREIAELLLHPGPAVNPGLAPAPQAD